MASSIVSYATNNFGMVFDNSANLNNFQTNIPELFERANFKSLLYLLLLGFLPSFFVIKTEITDLPLNSQIMQSVKAFLIMIIIFFLIIFGFSKLVDFPLKHNHPIRVHFTNIAKVVIPLKDLILMRSLDHKIAKLKSSGSCVFCDFSQADFKGDNLKGFDLSYAILSKANLTFTDLTEANLTGVDLSNMDLSKTTLSFANLTGANLSGADLNGVDLRNIDLTGVNLSEVDLRYLDLTGATLSGVDLSNKDLTGTVLSFADLTRTNLNGVDLSNKDLTGTFLIGVDLTGLDLSVIDLTGAILTLAKLDRPFAPTSLETTSVGGDFISVSWMDNANDETGYLVYISSGKKPNLPAATLAANTTSYTFENLNAENYRIWIEAAGSNLNSDALIKFQGTNGAPENKLKLDKSKGEWSLLVIPDTQHYVDKSLHHKAPLSAMVEAFDWIVLIADDLNIKMVQGLGDITQGLTIDSEWKNVSEVWYKLEGKVPFAPNTGNWDDEAKFKEYFPESRFVNEPWWGGNYDGILNSYQLMTIGNEDYLFLNVNYYEDENNINWINSIIDSYQDRMAILATHNTREGESLVREKVINQHDNIIMTNAGHHCREQYFIENGPSGGVSHNFVTDYQCDEAEVMLLRFYVFKPLEDKVDYFTYSPITNEFEEDYDSQSEFRLVQVDP